MSNTLTRYAYDPTGMNPDNLVAGEVHTLSLNKVRAVAPIYGAFFSNSVVVFDNTTDQPLQRGSQYQVVELLQDATLRLGQEICLLILILDTHVGNTVRLNYQVLGGMYQDNAAGIISMYETISKDNRAVNWVDIQNKPLEYTPTTHLHLLQDVYGFEPVVAAMERIRNAIVLGDVPAFEAFYDWVNGQIAGIASGMVSNATLQAEIAARMQADAAEAQARAGEDNIILAAIQALSSSVSSKQAALGFVPVQEGTGVGQQQNAVKIGWSGNRLKATVDTTDLGNIVFDTQLTAALSGLGGFLPVTGGTLSGPLTINTPAGVESILRQRGGDAGGVTYFDENNPENGIHTYRIVMDGGKFSFISNTATTYSGDSASAQGDLLLASLDATTGIFTAADVGNYSDPRLKDNVTPIDNVFDLIDGFEGVYFDWNSVSRLTEPKWGKRDMGVLSSQIKRIFPMAVSPSEPDPETGLRYDIVHYDKLVPPLIQLGKALKSKVVTLEEDAKLNAEVIRSLIARVEALEAK